LTKSPRVDVSDRDLGPSDGRSRENESLLDGLPAKADFDPLGEVAKNEEENVHQAIHRTCNN